MRLMLCGVAVLTLLGVSTPAGAANCSSSHGCTDCKQEKGKPAMCIPVEEDASCECSIDVLFPEFCILVGDCDYTGGGVGGGGGGGTGGETCYRLPSQWCPPECSSCETVFWL
jgi:hypothetical protein